MTKSKVIVISTIVIVIVGMFGVYSLTKDGTEASARKTAVLYKSPACGCCAKYTSYLKANGYDVEVVKTNDMSAIKDQYDIPNNMESCHTTIIDGHVVEGHVPIEGIDYLLEQRPDLDGIALPGMPAGSPGMPGFKAESFQIFALTNGVASDLINL